MVVLWLFTMMVITLDTAAHTVELGMKRHVDKRFLVDKMAYELGLTDAQYQAVYEINLDYLLNMQGERSSLRWLLDTSQ